MTNLTQLPTSPQLGRTEMSHRFAVAKLQVLWPLMCRMAIKGTVYGFADKRARGLGLERLEMLRWWHEFKTRGVAGAIPSGVQAKWKQWLPKLEERLQAEREEWAEAGDTFFIDALRSALEAANLSGGLEIVPELRKVWADLQYSHEGEETGVRPYKDYGLDKTIAVAERIGMCREILLQPIMARRYTDAAVNAYANTWSSTGPTMRKWLDWYRPELGYRSVMPTKLTDDQVDWLNVVEASVLALRTNDIRTSAPYWRDLVGQGVRAIGEGVASRRLEGEEAVLALMRYERVKWRVVQHLAKRKRRRNNDQAGIAKALGISEQTLTNWKNDFAAERSLTPRMITESMAGKLDEMEQVVTTLEATEDGDAAAEVSA